MKIAVFGNCQIVGIADCLMALSPEIQAQPFRALDAKSPAGADQLAAQMDNYDLVLSQRLQPEKYWAMGTTTLERAGHAVMVFPQITFTGFHPDIAILADVNAGRLGSCHSIITAGAYLAGAPKERVPALFNSYVFSRLGYFEEYARVKAFLSTQITKTQLDAESLFARWERLGQFMHTPNHPVIEVLWELAIDLCARLAVKPNFDAAIPSDKLAEILRLPVYPEIGRRLGVEGFHEVTLTTGQKLSVQDVVVESYKSYDHTTPALGSDIRIAAAADFFRAELDCVAA